MDITNPAQLKSAIEEQATKALEGATDEILRLFQNQYLMKYVYNSHGENKFYVPSWEFLEAWEFTKIQKVSSKLLTELWYNYSNMSFDADTFKHGSSWSKPNNVSSNLMKILDKEGFSSSSNLSVSRPVAYWKQFIIDMFDAGKLQEILSRHFVAQGFSKR